MLIANPDGRRVICGCYAVGPTAAARWPERIHVAVMNHDSGGWKLAAPDENTCVFLQERRGLCRCLHLCGSHASAAIRLIGRERRKVCGRQFCPSGRVTSHLPPRESQPVDMQFDASQYRSVHSLPGCVCVSATDCVSFCNMGERGLWLCLVQGKEGN